jgi:hypothetical protein
MLMAEAGMISKSDLEKELRQNLKLRRELQGEIIKAETGAAFIALGDDARNSGAPT